MESLTKNKQDVQVIARMVEKFFAPITMISCKELTEGFFNVAYEIQLSDGQEVILKIAPKKDMRIMTYERNMMHSEIEAMKQIALEADILAPKLIGSDESYTICDSPYFFMEKLEGKSLNAIKDSLVPQQLQGIYQEVGHMIQCVNEITCPYFGYPGQVEFQGDEWFPVFKKMLQTGILDAEVGDVDLKISTKELLSLLEKDKAIFDKVTKPQLVHWDCWDGNIFVKDGKLTGIIDWERCLWADPLMEVNFRTYSDEKWFMKGYGLEHLTDSQYRRALWYDVYALLLMSLECEYRQYETMDMYDWASGLLVQQVAKLK